MLLVQTRAMLTNLAVITRHMRDRVRTLEAAAQRREQARP